MSGIDLVVDSLISSSRLLREALGVHIDQRILRVHEHELARDVTVNHDVVKRDPNDFVTAAVKYRPCRDVCRLLHQEVGFLVFDHVLTFEELLGLKYIKS